MRLTGGADIAYTANKFLNLPVYPWIRLGSPFAKQYDTYLIKGLNWKVLKKPQKVSQPQVAAAKYFAPVHSIEPYPLVPLVPTYPSIYDEVVYLA